MSFFSRSLSFQLGVTFLPLPFYFLTLMTSHILCCNICIVIPLLNNQLPESISQIWFFIVFFYHPLVVAFTNSHDSLPLPCTNTLCYVTLHSPPVPSRIICANWSCTQWWDLLRLVSVIWHGQSRSLKKSHTWGLLSLVSLCHWLLKHARACLLEHERHVEQSYVT